MSWFGIGGSKKDDKPSEASLKISDDFDSGSHFENTPSSSYAPSGSIGGGFSAGGMEAFQQQVLQQQQAMIIQQVLANLTAVSFDACVSRPSSSLSYNEKDCIKATTGKYLETANLITQKMQSGGGH
jgi:hypothetical protein